TAEALPPPAPEVRTLPAPAAPPQVKSVVIVETPAAPVVARSPDRATEPTAGLPESRETSGQPAWHGQETVPQPNLASPPPVVEGPRPNLSELWEQELRTARRKLEPEGALTGATRELQAGLGSFLQICHEHGVKVGPWRLQHVVGELTFGDHPTYGVVTIA